MAIIRRWSAHCCSGAMRTGNTGDHVGSVEADTACPWLCLLHPCSIEVFAPSTGRTGAIDAWASFAHGSARL
jgi:hypothetical protein